MQIEIWSLGKANESFMDPAIQHYLKKVQPYNSVELLVLSAGKKGVVLPPDAQMKAEEELILNRLQAHHYLILMDEKGKMLSSPDWANQVQELMNRSTKTLVLLIGGAFGVTLEIKARAQQVWSLSKLVFPHQLVRLMVAEQVYRAFSILNNSAYHHA
ncbi:MAG: 23S rRNA (pseudouridine(1915)-N(3))-methyltransferase RlmH [Bacteroidetes bacterium]|nr:23S rRNA (pseudouridine(1915)-N(3))-methyltransferase RlmH [Bacteroidota bacterium]